MVTEYKVINEFGYAEVGDVFKYNEEQDTYNLSWDTVEKELFMSRNMVLSADFAKSLAETNFLEVNKAAVEPTIEATPTAAELKLMALQCLIDDLKTKYTARDNKVNKKYNAGKMQTCVKVEHDTVHFNLMKLLNQFDSIVNE